VLQYQSSFDGQPPLRNEMYGTVSPSIVNGPGTTATHSRS
jgi:hypothetical protein